MKWAKLDGVEEVVEVGEHTLILGDSAIIVPQLDDDDVDAMVSDPPYGIDANNFNLGRTAETLDWHRGDWDGQRIDISIYVRESWKTCIWGGNYYTDVLPPTNHWLIWFKDIKNTSFSECEMAWTNYGKQVRHLKHHWSGEKKRHPTQKPVKVMEWCLSFVDSGVTVLDPFMGSASTGVAVMRQNIKKRTSRRFVGIELDPTYFKVAVDRLQSVVGGRGSENPAGALF